MPSSLKMPSACVSRPGPRIRSCRCTRTALFHQFNAFKRLDSWDQNSGTDALGFGGDIEHERGAMGLRGIDEEASVVPSFSPLFLGPLERKGMDIRAAANALLQCRFEIDGPA